VEELQLANSKRNALRGIVLKKVALQSENHAPIFHIDYVKLKQYKQTT
jgi:hypothetical protein